MCKLSKSSSKELCEVAFEPAGPSSLSQEVAFEPAGPSSLSQEVAFEPAGPSSNVLSQLLIPQRKIATAQVTIYPIDFDYGCISFKWGDLLGRKRFVYLA